MLDLTRDGHVHTPLCRHAAGSMEEYVQEALRQGLHGLMFLEHFEAGINAPRRTWLTAEDFLTYREEGERLQKKYAGRLEIGLGVEVGFNPREIAATRDFLAAHDWDRVGLSCHFLEIGDRHYNLLTRNPETLAAFSDYGVERALADYFSRLLEAVAILPADVLCHLDAALRHHPQVATALARQSATPTVDRIFAILAARGMALEINTSGFDHRRRRAYPAAALLARAAAHDLPLLVGSDAHHPSEVGRYFDKVSVAA